MSVQTSPMADFIRKPAVTQIDPRPADPSAADVLVFLRSISGHDEQTLRLNWRGDDLKPGAVENAAFRRGWIKAVGLWKSGAKWTIGYTLTPAGRAHVNEHSAGESAANGAVASQNARKQAPVHYAPLTILDKPKSQRQPVTRLHPALTALPHEALETKWITAVDAPDYLLRDGWQLIGYSRYVASNFCDYMLQRVVNHCKALVPFGMYAPMIYTLENVQEIGF